VRASTYPVAWPEACSKATRTHAACVRSIRRPARLPRRRITFDYKSTICRCFDFPGRPRRSNVRTRDSSSTKAKGSDQVIVSRELENFERVVNIIQRLRNSTRRRRSWRRNGLIKAHHRGREHDVQNDEIINRPRAQRDADRRRRCLHGRPQSGSSNPFFRYSPSCRASRPPAIACDLLMDKKAPRDRGVARLQNCKVQVRPRKAGGL